MRIKNFLPLLLVSILSFFSCNNHNSTNINEIINDSTITIERLNNEIRKNPKSPDLFIKRGELYLAQNNLSEAINDFEIALKVDSTRQDIYVKLSDLYLKQGNSKHAKEILDKCLKYYPANVQARLKLGYLYLYLDLYREAMQQVIILERNNLQNADSYFLKGLILKQTKTYEDAALAFKKSLEFNKKNDQAYILLGLIYTELKNDVALEYFKTAANMFLDNAEVFYNQGFALQEFGKYKDAKESYLRAIELDSTYFEAYNNIGYLYLNFLNNNDEALKYFSKAISIKPDYILALYNRALVYEKIGKYKFAEIDYRKVLELYPNYDPAVEGLNQIIDKQRK